MEYEILHLINNDCYRSGKKINPKGIVVHSTGANNPSLKRYIGPDDGLLGANKHNNHWNQTGIRKCVHAFIGYDKNNQVRCYNTLPWDYRPWGCGEGKKGSFNNSHIQFEICEDSLVNADYFNQAFEKAVDLCVYLCHKFKIPPESIVSHKESHDLGYASNHGDPHDWLRKHSWDMDTFRNKVATAIKKIKITEDPVVSLIGKITIVYKGDDGVNIRQKPKLDKKNIVRVVYHGDILSVVDHTEGWYKLTDGNFISDNIKYVSFSG